MGSGAARDRAQAAFPGKAQFAEHGALHGRAALHLQSDMREVRRGLLAADMDAGQPENPGVAVRETLPEDQLGIDGFSIHTCNYGTVI